MTRLVLFNGPPGCGKDTIVRGLTQYLKFSHLKFAAPIKRMACGLLDCDMSWLEANKDTFIIPFGYKHDITLRQFLIELSEKFFKPLYGDNVFGNLLWNEVKRAPNKLVLVSDCGFHSEVHRVVGNAGKANCLIVRIHRSGHNFVGDSRSYLEDGICKTVDVYNTHTSHWLTIASLRVIMNSYKGIEKEFLKEPEWLRDIPSAQ